MNRPRWREIILRILPSSLILAIGLGCTIYLDFTHPFPWWARILLYLPACLLGLYCLREILIGLVLFYQKVASEEIRGECRFEPSCSHYMILALRKYGFPIGFIKGIIRILRCHPPNGGIDYP